MTRPNSVSTEYTYDYLSRLLSVLHKLSGGTIDGATYTVDAVGNRTAKANLLPSAPAENYTYDNIYQLTQVAQAGPTTTESYSYDAVGNRLSSLAATWSYNSSNHLTSISGSPGTTFTYDNNGNTVSKTDSSGTTSYTWDYENRLTQVTLPGSGGTVSFKYDPLGRRIYKSSFAGTTVFVYDRENLIEEVDANGNLVARYSMGLNIDEPFAMLRSSATDFYQADGLGSITSLSDSSGSLVSTYTYDTFGNLAASTGSVVNPFQYTAREWDVETGLYFYRARYYDQATGRFLLEDPIGFMAGPNFHTYVSNTPTAFTDPRGLAECVYSVSSHALTCTASLPLPTVGDEEYKVQVGPEAVLTSHARRINRMKLLAFWIVLSLIFNLAGCVSSIATETDHSRLARIRQEFGGRVVFEPEPDTYLNAYFMAEEPSEEEAVAIYKAFWFSDDKARRNDSSFAYLNVYDARRRFRFQLFFDPKTKSIERSEVERYEGRAGGPSPSRLRWRSTGWVGAAAGNDVCL